MSSANARQVQPRPARHLFGIRHSDLRRMARGSPVPNEARQDAAEAKRARRRARNQRLAGG